MKLENVGAPKLLYLQDSECKGHEDTEGITWCGDPVGDDDTVYIRMDVHNETLRHLAIAVAALQSISEYWRCARTMTDACEHNRNAAAEALARIKEEKK